MYKKIFILALLLIFFSIPVHSETTELSPEKRTDIIKLLKMTGVVNVMAQVVNTISSQMVDSLIKASGRKVPERATEIIKTEMNNLWDQEIKSEKFFDYFVPIYNKYYSHKEIKELINFYKTDLGRKTIDVLPSLTQECMIAGQNWGKSLQYIAVRRINQRLKAEGIDLKD
jgi:hypothetical protein